MSRARIDLNYFLEGELEVADDFISEANTFIMGGRYPAARDSLQYAESALEIIERYLQGIESSREGAKFAPLIDGRRNRVQLIQKSIPV